MPESTVLDSVFGALGSMASASDRRAREGLEAAQAEEIAIRNTANKKILEQNAAQELTAEIDGLGFMKFNDDGSYDVDVIGLSAASPSLASKFLAGGNADRWFNHTGPDGKPTNLTFSRFVEVPTQLGAAPAPAAPAMGAMPNQLGQQLDNTQGPTSLLPGQIPQAPAAAPADAPAAAPKRYMMLLKNEKGEEVPATQNGSKDPKDPLITMSEDDIREKGRLATVRLQALKGMQNDVTLQKQQMELSTIVEERIKQELLDSGGAELDFDAAAKREFLAAIDTADGDELREMAIMLKIDPDAIRKEAEDEWTANIQAKVKNSNLKPTTGFDYDKTKAGLEDLATKAEKALADYDAAAARKQVLSPGAKPTLAGPPEIAKFTLDPTTSTIGTVNRKSQAVIALEKKYGPQMTENQLRGYDPSTRVATNPKDTPERKKLQAAVDFAKSAASNLVRPAVKDALPTGTPEPKFEWTDENLRASIRGELDQPTPEQSSALAQYGQSQGIKQASDLSRVPPARAKALVWAIVANSGGTPDEKMKLFDNLNSYVQTGDPDKSAIDAGVAIAGARAQTANAVTAADAVAAQRENAALDYAAVMAGVAQRDRELTRQIYNDNQDVLKEIDAAAGKVAPLLNTIYEGTIVDGGKFKPEGPSQEAFAAFKELDANVDLPPGSPLMYASSKRYLEGFMTMAMSQAQKPGATAWWDWTKAFANTFLREDGMIDLSPLVEQAYVKKWKNGLPEEIGFSEGGARSGKPTTTVGAAEFSRYMGTSGMAKFMEAIYFQKAANALGSGATPEAIAAKSLELKTADGYTKPY